MTPSREWPLYPAQLANPMELLIADRARAVAARDPHSNFATFITVDKEGQPYGRTVTLRALASHEVLLSANATSPKVRQLLETGRCELLIYWSSVQRQFRVRGECAFVHLRDEPQLEKLYRESPHRAKAWDWLYEEAPQSTVVANREAFAGRFESIAERLLEESGDPAEVAPAQSAGYLRLAPAEVEIKALDMEWRVHDRRVYRKLASGEWTQEWLVP